MTYEQLNQSANDIFKPVSLPAFKNNNKFKSKTSQTFVKKFTRNCMQSLKFKRKIVEKVPAVCASQNPTSSTTQNSILSH